MHGVAEWMQSRELMGVVKATALCTTGNNHS